MLRVSFSWRAASAAFNYLPSQCCGIVLKHPSRRLAMFPMHVHSPHRRGVALDLIGDAGRRGVRSGLERAVAAFPLHVRRRRAARRRRCGRSTGRGRRGSGQPRVRWSQRRRKSVSNVQRAGGVGTGGRVRQPYKKAGDPCFERAKMIRKDRGPGHFAPVVRLVGAAGRRGNGGRLPFLLRREMGCNESGETRACSDAAAKPGPACRLPMLRRHHDLDYSACVPRLCYREHAQKTGAP